VTAKLNRQEVINRVVSGLPNARWEYDAEADEMEIVLPGGNARAGRAVLIDPDVYLRLDVDTNEPLTIIIPAYSDWMSRRAIGSAPPPGPADPPQVWRRVSYVEARRSLRQTVRYSNELAAAVP
jgi:hypothetical protein